MAEGWIKLHRKIIESSVFDNPKLLKLWVWCLCKASHSEREIVIGKQIVKINPGQFVFGRLAAADALKMNDRTVYDYIKTLEKLGMICINSNNKYSLVTVVNWELYQCSEYDNQQQSTIKSTMQSTMQSTIESTIKNDTNKNVKNDKECIKNVKNIFRPPTVEDVKAYCIERNNGIDAESFVSFYESKGWMIGKNKMKDWKAAVRTWERSRKQNQTVNTGIPQGSNQDDLDAYF